MLISTQSSDGENLDDVDINEGVMHSGIQDPVCINKSVLSGDQSSVMITDLN